MKLLGVGLGGCWCSPRVVVGARVVSVGATSGQTSPCNRPRGTHWRCGSVELFLLVWWWRPLASEGDPQVMDDLINDLIVGDEGYNLHLAAAIGTDERVNLINLLYEFPPTW